MVDWKQYIERNPQVMLGKPTFTGTRITVEFILERMAQGAEAADLLDNYEGLRREHLLAALAYATSLIRNEEVIAAS